MAAAAGLPTVSHSTESLYGTPGSKSAQDAANLLHRDKLKLSLSKAGIPVEMWQSLSSMVILADIFSQDSSAVSKFRSNPGRFLKEHGLSAEIPLGTEKRYNIIAAITDQDIARNRHKGVKNTLETLAHKGYISPQYDQLILDERSTETLKQRIQAYRPVFEKINEKIRAGETVDFAENEIDYIASTLMASDNGKACSVAAAACVAVTVAAVYQYVVAAVAVIAETALAIHSAIAAQISVFTGADDHVNRPYDEMPTWGNLYISNNSEGKKDIQFAIKMARLSGDIETEENIKRFVVQKEIDILIRAMEATGSLELMPDTQEKLTVAMTNLAYRMIRGKA